MKCNANVSVSVSVREREREEVWECGCECVGVGVWRVVHGSLSRVCTVYCVPSQTLSGPLCLSTQALCAVLWVVYGFICALCAVSVCALHSVDKVLY